MRVIMRFEGDRYPPLLRFFVFGSPHRRQGIEVILAYRRELTAAVRRAGVATPIDHPVDVDITLIDPCSPDLGSSYTAFEQAVDGKTYSGVPAALVDDGLIQAQATRKLYPHARHEASWPLRAVS